jgi:hypothetical protein
MEGVILFADDHVFRHDRIENKLFNKLNSEGNFPTLPIDNLSILEKTISSVSTFRAIILDWNFKKDSGVEGVTLPDETPYGFLKSNKIHSLVYVYSQAKIDPDKIAELNLLYPNKIFFETKNTENELDTEYDKIITGIKKFETDNQHLETPFLWSQAINSSVQTIFNELENADPNWVKEIYLTAKNDGAEPNAEVIGIFQNLLNESIIQNNKLTTSIADSAALPDVIDENKEESLAKLYHRIYYSRLMGDAPIMTGDIFQFDENEFAILITPECDVSKKKDNSLEFLRFNKNSFVEFLEQKKQYKKENFEAVKLKDKQFKDLASQFNNGIMAYHVLTSFPFENNIFNSSAFIDFETASIVKQKDEFDNKRSQYKLNAPYIYQLRQRYLAYIGRVGVPAIPPSLKAFNLK